MWRQYDMVFGTPQQEHRLAGADRVVDLHAVDLWVGLPCELTPPGAWSVRSSRRAPSSFDRAWGVRASGGTYAQDRKSPPCCPEFT